MRIAKKRHIVGAAFLIAFLFWTPLEAIPAVQASPDSSSLDRLSVSYLKKSGRDFLSVVTAPAKWRRSDLLKFAALAGTGVLLYSCDRNLYDWIQKNKSPASMDASAYISKFGNGGYLTAFLAAMYASGELFDSPGLRKTALLSLESFLTTSVFVLTLKVVAGRARPSSGESAHSFDPFSLKTDHLSFPSGDAAGAFAVATTIADQSSEFFVDVLAYSLAGLVAIYRVHDGKHWPADVFAGSALGFFVAKKISHLNKKYPAGNYHIALQITPQRQAFTLSLYF